MGYGGIESDGEDDMIHDEQASDVEEDSDDDVVEIENPNPIVPEPTLRYPVDLKMSLKRIMWLIVSHSKMMRLCTSGKNPCCSPLF